MKKAVWILMALLIVSNAVTAYFLWQSYQTEPAPVVTPVITPPATTTEALILSPEADEDNDGLNNQDETELYKTDPLKVDTDGDGYSDKEELDFGYDPLVAGQTMGDSETIEIDWQTPVDIKVEDFFGTEKEMKAKFPDAFNGKGQFIWPDNQDESVVINFTKKNDDFNFYEQFHAIKKVGTVRNGLYQGKSFYIMTRSCWNCMGTNDIELRFIDTGQGYVCLKKHSDDCFATPAIFQTDNKLYIKNLISPKFVKVPNSQILLFRNFVDFVNKEYDNVELSFMAKDKEVIFADDWFQINQPDSSTAYYSYNFYSTPFEKESGALNVVWLDGTSNENIYVSMGGGCGSSFGVSQVYADYVSSSTLKQAGTAGDGSIIYELANPNMINPDVDEKVPVLKSMYDNEYASFERENKLSYVDFVKSRPLIFWQDPFGRFIQFKNSAFEPLAECGKPVIYLYPEKETAVSVQVEPTGGFKLTEPIYNNGWQVTAKPNGELTNLADGQKYPYLFWEGYAYDYVRPSQGWVVPENKVKPFLEKVLAKLGLIKVEADEFIAFWEPRMHEQPYYFVSFVPQEQFDKMAPLTVSPKPDTVIRVFMDYQGLNAPVLVQEPKIVTPERRGFTVVEWGGAVHR